ncbi:MAG TPA: hypothetical protein VL400_01260, partial [Polyangiaceae bacterium]|nr:hypothetical protein [Polyangiaceae bacterium]
MAARIGCDVTSSDGPSNKDAAAAERAALVARIDAMVRDPSSVGGAVARLFAPVLRVVGWQARFESSAVRALLAGIVAGSSSATAAQLDEVLAERLASAKKELEANLAQAERACSVHGYVPTAHASWFYRVADVLARVESLGESRQHRVLVGMDPTRVLPPLALATPEPKNALEAKAAEDEPEAPAPTGQAARLLELELAAIDHITEAARSETRFLERRRRLFEGARRLLLDASAALRLDPEGVRAREQNLAAEIVRVDRLQAAGLSPTVALGFQAKQALRRGERDKLYAALVALDGFAVSRGEASVAERTGFALDALGGSDGSFTGNTDGREHGKRSLERSAEEMFGAEVVATLKRTYEATRRTNELGGPAGQDPELTRLALAYLAPGAESAALGARVSVDGCFEV